jgi:hypothetical protein
VDVRDSASPVIVSASRWLARINARHPWSHNDYTQVTGIDADAGTLAQITAAARARLPGVTLRRRLFFRYTLRWDKPAAIAQSASPS